VPQNNSRSKRRRSAINAKGTCVRNISSSQSQLYLSHSEGAPRKKRNRACSLCKGNGVFTPSKPMAFGLKLETGQPEECTACKGLGTHINNS
jgi:DnaJ-class molecular chaperone